MREYLSRIGIRLETEIVEYVKENFKNPSEFYRDAIWKAVEEDIENGESIRKAMLRKSIQKAIRQEEESAHGGEDGSGR